MKGSSIFLLAGLAGGLFWLVGRKTLATGVRFSIESAKIVSGKVQLTIGIMNPTRQKAILSAIVGDFFLNGKQIATIEYYNKVTILPTAKTKITLLVTPKALGIINTIFDIFTGSVVSSKIAAKLIGTSTIDGIALPLNIDYAA